MGKNYDFSGWATRNNLRCSDGRTILKDAFRDCDGKVVPLVWNHQHNETSNVLGHALLENRDDGVYTYGYLNETPDGKNAKEMLRHGDINSLSIYANQLQQNHRKEVMHGEIREVSLVLAGANPGAYIDEVMVHGESLDDEFIVNMGTEAEITIENELSHAEEKQPEEKGDKKMAENNSGSEKTVKDVWDTLNEEQKNVVYAIIGEAVENNEGEDKEDKEDMKHNAFDTDHENNDLYLSHADQAQIIKDGKKYGSLKASLNAYAESMGFNADELMHSDADYGIVRSEDKQDYFVNDPSFLFPEAKALNETPAWIQRPTEWVASVMGGTTHTPFSRIKTLFADITEDAARAKGYIKGKMKKEEVFTLLKRTTEPTTIYKKQKMDRDDVADITTFDVIAWIKAEMRMMLDEEIARAILVGDGRLADDDDKIDETKIRPIWTDHELFSIKRVINFTANESEDDKAKKMIKEAVRARKDYRGSGNPTLYTTEDWLTTMLLLEDSQGYRLYKTIAELAAAMRVSKIVAVPIMENLYRTDSENKRRDLMGIIVNMKDYRIGADKLGAVNMFDGFDLDYNQQKYLIETRMSGSLDKPYSAIVLESITAAG